MSDTSEYVSPNITRFPDGTYTWTYEMSLFKNPTVFWLVWKIFFFILLGLFLVLNIVDAAEWSDYFPDRFLSNLTFLGYALAGMTALVGLGYLIYAAMMGGKYVVEFDMDERGVNHRQIMSQAKRARRIGAATVAAGIATGRPGTVGIGLNAQRTEMYSEFAKTRAVKLCPRRHLIKVSGLLNHNQVYAAPEDFDFVSGYILSRCPNLKP